MLPTSQGENGLGAGLIDLDVEAEFPRSRAGSAARFCDTRTYIFIKLSAFRSIFTFPNCVHFNSVSGVWGIMECFVQSLVILHALTQQPFMGWGWRGQGSLWVGRNLCDIGDIQTEN